MTAGNWQTDSLESLAPVLPGARAPSPIAPDDFRGSDPYQTWLASQEGEKEKMSDNKKVPKRTVLVVKCVNDMF